MRVSAHMATSAMACLPSPLSSRPVTVVVAASTLSTAALTLRYEVTVLATTVLAPSASVMVAVTVMLSPRGSSVLFTNGADPSPRLTSIPALLTKLKMYATL